MQKLSHRDLLEQAQTAAQEGDWSTLSQKLHALILDENAPIPSKTLFAESQTAELLLSLSLQVLEFGSFQERWEIAKILPQFGTEIIRELINVLCDDESDPEAQWFAIRILGGFNHPDVVTALIDLLQTFNSEELSSMAVMALAQMGKTAIAPLTQLLHQDSTRLLAVQTLGHIRHSETVPLLLTVAQDADAQIRAIAIESLSSFHSPEITQALIQALKDLSPIVRCNAVTGLGFRNDKLDLVRHLHPMLRDFNLDVCCQSAIALSKTGQPEAAFALFEVLQSPHTPEKLAIETVRSLSWMSLPEALQFLHRALISLSLSDAIRLEIVQALGRVELLKSEATQILLMIIQTQRIDEPLLRQAIATALGQLGDLTAMDALIQLLADPDVGVRLHVIAALKSLNAEQAYHRLETLSQTQLDGDLEQGIAIALSEWSFPI